MPDVKASVGPKWTLIPVGQLQVQEANSWIMRSKVKVIIKPREYRSREGIHVLNRGCLGSRFGWVKSNRVLRGGSKPKLSLGQHPALK